ncbi:MAG TPA: hypothetical protein VIV60_35720 [Polyangiaceae bacterium]
MVKHSAVGNSVEHVLEERTVLLFARARAIAAWRWSVMSRPDTTTSQIVPSSGNFDQQFTFLGIDSEIRRQGHAEQAQQLALSAHAYHGPQ